MKQTVNESDFVQAFQAIRPDQFTYQGLRALYEWLEEMEADTGTESELDVIALCCDFSEYENLAEFQGDYGGEYATVDDIQDATFYIPVGNDGAFITQQF